MKEPVSSLTASRIADCNKIPVTGPRCRVPRSISFDLDLLERLDAKCKDLKVDRSEVIRRLVQIWLEETPKQATQPESGGEPTGSPAPDKYLADLAKQWATLSQQQRDAHLRTIVRNYGPAGGSFINTLPAT